MTVVVCIAIYYCVLAANLLTSRFFAEGVTATLERDEVKIHTFGWPISCIYRIVTTPVTRNLTTGAKTRGRGTAEYQVLRPEHLCVNLFFLIYLPFASAATTERLIRRWQRPFQFQLSTILWCVSGVAVLLAAIRTEQVVYSGQGGGPIDALHPWVKVPVLFGCLCTLYVTLLVIWQIFASMKAAVVAFCHRLR